MWVLLVSHAVVDLQYFCRGRQPREGVGGSTPDAAKFHKICMSKQHNCDPWGYAPLGSATVMEYSVGTLSLPPQ